MLALFLAAATPQTAIDAERAFAADAQMIGQWAAFRKWAAADATMFVPQPTRAQDWLKDRKEPAKAVEWWPTASWVSCDGKLAVNTGGSRWSNGSVDYFTTVWQRQDNGDWRWIVDGGDGLTAARRKPLQPKIKRASCKPPRHLPEPPLGVETRVDAGSSKDQSLVWWFEVAATGARQFHAELWNGRTFDPVIDDRIAAAAP